MKSKHIAADTEAQVHVIILDAGEEAAASMGIPVNRVKIICFMLCSVLAGFAGLIQVLRLNSPLPSICARWRVRLIYMASAPSSNCAARLRS